LERREIRAHLNRGIEVGAAVIASMINGLPVTSIGSNAFHASKSAALGIQMNETWLPIPFTFFGKVTGSVTRILGVSL